MIKTTLKSCTLSLLMLLCISVVFAQQSITGKVSDSSGPLKGVSIFVKGTSKVTQSDNNGSYSIQSESGQTLRFSMIGYTTQEILVSSAKTINVTLATEEGTLDEVVVTALGIKREAKSLGYAVQEIKGDVLTGTRETNVANALSGQVAGLQVVKGSNGPGGSSKIVLRGFNSLEGDNQPLIVVDGVPMNNFTGQDNSDYWNPSLDMGNGLGDINSEDIESITVLKGGAAAALYGNRAGNGVIQITTKSGRKTVGLGLTVSSSVGFENPFMIPKMQNNFGQGKEGIYDNESMLSWGPEITGQTIQKWNGESATMQSYNNLNSFLETGVLSNQNISFQQQYGNTSIYSSYNRVDNTSMIPEAKLTRNNILLRSLSTFANDKLTFDAKIQYNNTIGNNRPLGGQNPSSNAFAMMYLFPRSLDITDFKNSTQPNGDVIWWGNADNKDINPYWAAKYRLNSDERDRYMMNGSLKYKATDWLTAEIKAGSDMYNTKNDARQYGGLKDNKTGRFSMGTNSFLETNYSAMLTAQKDNLFDKIGGSIMLGGNIMDHEYNGLKGDAGELEVPNFFSLNAGKNNPKMEESFSKKKVNSIFGAAQVSYDNYLFLDATFRNDWSSTMKKENRSFFYPSLSASFVFSDLISKTSTLPSWFSYGKIRGSFAEVGNDLQPYQLYNTYWIGKDQNGITNAGRNKTLFDENVVSELIRKNELGLEMRFFNSKLGFDLTYYKSNALNQLIKLPMDPQSGYDNRMVNAGNIQNEGFEAVVTANIFQNPEGFNWRSLVNFSRNKNTIIELSKSLDIYEYQLGGYDALRIMAVAGAGYGDIYGYKNKTVTDQKSEHFGKTVVNGDGQPLLENKSVILGNQQADFLLGWNNSFSYKNLSLSFLIDARIGGEIFSGTNQAMQTNGTATATVVNGKRDEILVDGVVEKGDGTYSQNTKAVRPELYWNWMGGITSNLGIHERNIYDATNIRLRNVQVNYQLPKEWLAKAGVQRASIGASCNNVWMLKSHLNGVDPESVYSTGTNAVGFENMSSPTSRTFFVNLSLSF